MLLTALLDGDRVDATTYNAESWAELQNSGDRRRIVMPVCEIRAVAKTRGASTRYFAHYRKTECKVEHGWESPQHLAMKEALKLCIDRVPVVVTGFGKTCTVPDDASELLALPTGQNFVKADDRLGASSRQCSGLAPPGHTEHAGPDRCTEGRRCWGGLGLSFLLSSP